jgi:DNA-binding transcriptional regulator YiaG
MWKDIKNNEGKYKINEKGEVFSVFSNRVIKPLLNKKCGRLQIKLRNNKWGRIHRLVAETFIPNPKNLPQVNHKNGDKLDNRVENLEWCTAKENIQHSIRIGTFKKTLAPFLSKSEIEFIREKKGKVFQSVLAKMFNVHRGYISNIQLGKKRIYI